MLLTRTAHCVTGSYASTLDQLQYGLGCRWQEQAAVYCCCQPCNVGLGRLGSGLSQDVHTNTTKLARLVICCRAASVAGSCSSTHCFLLKTSHLTSPRVLSVDGMCFPDYRWHRVLVVRLSLVYSNKTLCFFHR